MKRSAFVFVAFLAGCAADPQPAVTERTFRTKLYTGMPKAEAIRYLGSPSGDVDPAVPIAIVWRGENALRIIIEFSESDEATTIGMSDGKAIQPLSKNAE